jgi:hypothetical protein
MIAKNVVKRTKLEEIYSESLIHESRTQPNGFDWVKSLHDEQNKMVSNDSINLIRKDVIKTKPFQIKHGIEHLDQENRQIKLGLNFVQSVNKDLKMDVDQREINLEYLKSLIRNSRTEVPSINRGKADSCYQNFNEESSKKEVGFSHLNKNLQLQIHLTNKDVKKLEAQLETMKSSEDFYNLIELIAVRTVYAEEFERLIGVKGHLDKILQDVYKDKKSDKSNKNKLAKIKIVDLEDQIQISENDILKSEKFIRDLRQKTNLLMKEQEYADQRNLELQNQIEKTNSEIQALSAKIRNINP